MVGFSHDVLHNCSPAYHRGVKLVGGTNVLCDVTYCTWYCSNYIIAAIRWLGKINASFSTY